MAARFVLGFALVPGLAAAAAPNAVVIARQAKAAADDKAAAALKDLSQYAQRNRGDADQAALALRIEDLAANETADQVAAAKKDFQSKSAALSKLADKAVAPTAQQNETEAELSHQLHADRFDEEKAHADAEAAVNAAKQLLEARKKQRQAMRRHYHEMMRDEKARAKQLGKAMKQASHEALRAAKRVERAQRDAGVSEKQYEGEYDRAHDTAEDLGEDLRGKAEDNIEHFYEGVEHRLEARMDAIEHEAESKDREQRLSIDNFEQRIRAAEMASASAAGSAAVSKTDKKKKESSSVFSETSHVPSAGSAVALATQLAPQSTGVRGATLLGFAAFGVTTSALMAFGRRRAEIREVPLLG